MLSRQKPQTATRACRRCLLVPPPPARSFSRSAPSSRRNLAADEIRARDEGVNSFVYVAEHDAGVPTPGPASSGALEGWSVAVKDNICTRDMITSCSSAMLAGFQPPYDATPVSFLRTAGARIVGKTNCDEFGMGSANVYSAHGPVVNPAGPGGKLTAEDRGGGRARVAGGSSGGSAAAVRTGLCRAALGTDTGGSIRLPASYCGVYGLKPSYGLVSRWGTIAYADSLDTVGVLAGSVEDARAVFDVISVHDPRDPTSIPEDVRTAALRGASEVLATVGDGDGPLRGLRVGVPAEYFPHLLSPSILPPIRRILSTLRSLGAALVPVRLPNTPFALSAYYVIASAEASSNLARYDGVRYGYRSERDTPKAAFSTTPSSSDAEAARGDDFTPLYSATRTNGFGEEVKRRILLGTYALTADAFDNYFLQAQRVRRLVRDDFDRLFRSASVLRRPAPNVSAEDVRRDGKEKAGVDLLVHPSAIGVAPVLSSSGLAAASKASSVSSTPPRSAATTSTSSPEKDGMAGISSYIQDVLTVPASLAGLPALNIPAGRSTASSAHDQDDGGWPVGVTMVAQWGAEEVIWKAAKALEDELGVLD